MYRHSLSDGNIFIIGTCIHWFFHPFFCYRYLSTSTYLGEDAVHIRCFDNDLPTKKGIRLNLTQARCLSQLFETLDNNVARAWKASGAYAEPEYSVPLGWGTYITVSKFHDVVYYDIRRFWKPPGASDPVATRRGINLTKPEAQTLANLLPSVGTVIPSYNDIDIECWCAGQQNQLAFAQCSRCNPFDYMNW